MGAYRPLTIAFERARTSGADQNSTDDDALEAALSGAVARGRAAWPALELSDEVYAAHLGARVSRDELASARHEDLWLACACMTEEPNAAIVALESRFFPDIEAALRRMRMSDARIEELKQLLRNQLFVGTASEGVKPRIGSYRGAGELGGWLRITATRAALKLRRKDARETPQEDELLLREAAKDDDPELAYLKATYRAAFKEAFQEALDALEPRQRLLLKQHVVDGLSIDEVGALYAVHRATAARWIASAREELLERTRKVFAARVRVSADEFANIMGLVRSQLDLSIRRRLTDVLPRGRSR